MIRPRLPFWMTSLILLCCLIEAVLSLAPMFGYGVLRPMANMTGGFWSPLLSRGGGLYPGQPLLMFLTYGLLHGGLMHLAMNMISLAAVGRELARFMRPWPLFVVYLVSQIAAGLLFALMSPAPGPMVGASGAIFGLAGALFGQAIKWRRVRGMSMWPIWRAVLIVGGLNIALTLLVPQIAWQAHLGGIIAGFALGLLWPLRRDRHRVEALR
ncbi:rhomboid family intramembrane serine protease [Paracoccus alkanivorans]|uniref:Rhomboid family intramembrane serine protease n=1 Tax=Paracoccus alkanivorans TaxID=2116655 RepID=A0A3M0MDW0_9RHOB|nr:rhomboid family intramembrane serine protease [Paracoccus alkanivorans]RMC35535.1 rhomboid family intramembrane serine protease [Paracoccus alkanivorans]